MKEPEIHTMVDIETMGNRPGCAIVAIGAVQFRQNDTIGIVDEFYHTINLNQQIREYDMHIDADTVLWWLKQGDDARQAISDDAPEDFAHDMHVVLSDLNRFMHRKLKKNQEPKIWANGADFDLPILAAAYRACYQRQPWKFWNSRCYRTIKNLHRDVKMQRTGTHHNALDDAKSQAMHLLDIASQNGITLT